MHWFQQTNLNVARLSVSLSKALIGTGFPIKVQYIRNPMLETWHWLLIIMLMFNLKFLSLTNTHHMKKTLQAWVPYHPARGKEELITSSVMTFRSTTQNSQEHMGMERMFFILMTWHKEWIRPIY